MEIWSAGTYPTGITPDKLSKSHQSVQRNPIIADIFNRAGLIEKWGRGTNRVIEMCRQTKIAPPKFEEITGAAVVTFKVNVLGAQQTAEQGAVHVKPQVGTKSALSQHQVAILEACRAEQTLVQLLQVVGRTDRTKFRNLFIRPLLESGLLQLTVPGKPRSRMQRYRLTPAGEAALKRAGNR